MNESRANRPSAPGKAERGAPSLLRLLFEPPVLETVERTARARLLHSVAWSALGLVAGTLLLLSLLQPGTLARRLMSILVMLLLVVGLIGLNRSGRTRLASYLLVLGLDAVLFWRALTAGGMSAPAGYLFILVTMLGDFFSTRGEPSRRRCCPRAPGWCCSCCKVRRGFLRKPSRLPP